MAPAEGYWGVPTATIDWCEENYVVSRHIAEFWNTVSNISMIIPPLVGLMVGIKDRLESRILFCYAGLLVVGIGSWLFHMTLRYYMQLMDELPMIWGSSFMVYSYLLMSSPPKYGSRGLQLALIAYCTIVTVIYLVYKNPVFHEVAYGLMVTCMVLASTVVVLKNKCSLKLFVGALATYMTGFILWNIDNSFCHHLRYARANLLGPVGPLTELHAWWHLLAGIGTYLSLLFVTHTRALFLKKKPELKLWCGFFLYVRVPEGGKD